jgi:outer membrane protein
MNKGSFFAPARSAYLGFGLWLFFIFWISTDARAQAERLSLKDVVALAKWESPASLRTATIKENRYWQYRTYLSDYKPQLVLDGSERYTNEVVPVQQPDGSIDYRSVHQNRGGLSMSLEQQIGFSGSRLFISSSLDRFDNFLHNNTRYGGNPAFIGINQPLFRFNDLRWNRKIEPLRYEESQRDYVEDLESISVTATRLFFDLLLAQADLNIAKINLQNNDTIYRIAEGRFNLGKLSEGELLQLELSLMRSRQQVARARLDMETTSLRLKSYIGLNNSDSIALVPPAEIPEFKVDETVALQEAYNNREDAISFKRRQLEADRDLVRAKRNSGLVADITATYGITNQGRELGDVYRDPATQQAVILNFSVPIIDWGRQRSRIKTAQANQQLVEYTVEQDQINFEQEVFTQVKLFKMLREQTKIAIQSDDIAQRRYDLSRNRYLIGKVSITDLNIAMQEKDEARRSYIAALRDFWEAYYRLRQLTLYDFETGARIIPEE